MAVDEGSLFHMGKLVITGLSLDAERALRVTWKLAPNDVFDGAWIEDMFVKLEKPTSEIFGRLRCTTPKWATSSCPAMRRTPWT